MFFLVNDMQLNSQKSDPRPLVKVVTPIIRLLANLCAGPLSEAACLFVIRHPDLVIFNFLTTQISVSTIIDFKCCGSSLKK